MKQCPNGHEVGDRTKFCPNCGAEVADNGTKFCAKCGNKRKGTEKFCSQCGTPFGASPIPDNNKKTKKSPKKGVIIASVVCLLVLAAGGAGWYFSQKDEYSLEGLAMAAVNYDRIDDFHDGLAIVYKGEKYGYIDKMGNEVIPCIYDDTEEPGYDGRFHDSLALVRQGDRLFFINRDGKEAFPFNYEKASIFSEGLAVVWKDGKCGYIDKNGNEVIALTDKFSGSDFSDGLAGVWKDEKYGYIDKKGNLVIPMQYKYEYDEYEGGYGAYSFNEGLALLLRNGKWGYIDKKGNEVVSCKYEIAYDFSDGLAAVYNGSGWGYIDKNGNEVIPCSFNYAGYFSEGYAIVEKDGNHFFINKKGEKVFSYSFKESQYARFSDGLAAIKKDTTGLFVGYIDKNGNEIIPCIYNSYNDFSEGLAVVEKDGIWGFVDKKGNSTFDIQNEDVKRIVQAKINEKEEKRQQEEMEEMRKEKERRLIEERNSSMNESYGYDKPTTHVDISGILRECELEIRQIQTQIEELCNTFVLLSSGDVDMLTYGRLKTTMLQGVREQTNKANRTFDNCIRKLNEIGETQAANKMKDEKGKFYKAVERIKNEAQQRAEAF